MDVSRGDKHKVMASVAADTLAMNSDNATAPHKEAGTGELRGSHGRSCRPLAWGKAGAGRPLRAFYRT